MTNNRIGVVGLGYVGLPLALLAREKGFEVTGIDNDSAKVQAIGQGQSPFLDEAISAKLSGQPLAAATSYAQLQNVDIIIICVPTPVDETYQPDLALIVSASEEIAKILKPGQLVVIESTINPGVSEEVVLPILEKNSGLKCGQDFYLAHCPERINPGDPKWNVGNISRVVGGYDKESLELAVKFYGQLISGTVKPMQSLREAEAVKVVENSFRDVNIAFVNELAMSFTALDIDVANVIDGAATKPFGFMAFYPGAGVGGHCIPVDPYYLIEYAKKMGFTHRFLKAAREINNQMPEFTIQRLADGLAEIDKQLKDSNVTVLGLSYKPNVGDLRESPALKIIKSLQRKGVAVAAHDPYVPTKAIALKQHGTSKSQFSDQLERSMAGADAIVLATAHSQYQAITPALLKKLGVKVVVDGRNMFDKAKFKQSGLVYRGIGR